MEKAELKLISQGAEARIFSTSHGNHKRAILKYRFSKTYRHPDLDKKS